MGDKLMSEEQVQKDDQEPSMEEILASIRRILAEDEVDSEDSTEETSVETSAENEKPELDQVVSTEEAESTSKDESAHQDKPATVPEMEHSGAHPKPQLDDHGRPAMQDIFELTQDMVSDPDMMSGVTMQQSADLLGDLARAIIDRRDMKVADEGSDANITLEMMVREMLKPLLREWLDRNLPYLIERMVKKEIDQMVNRAQRLDDSL